MSERLLQVGSFVSDRVDDLEVLENKVKSWGVEPRHMRRRTRSHKSYKFPYKQKKDHQKPTNRKKKRLRLPDRLHVWHAKRMYMDIDGNAEEPFDKGQRFVLDQSIHGCTLHDCSYLTCLSISSPHLPVDIEYSSRMENITLFRGICPMLVMWSAKDTVFMWVDPRAEQVVRETLKHAKTCSMSMFRMRGDESSKVLKKSLSVDDNECWNDVVNSVHLPSSLPVGFGMGVYLNESAAMALDNGAIKESSDVVVHWCNKASWDVRQVLESKYIGLVRNIHNGWDLFLPKSMTMYVWMSLIFNGAVASGLINERLANVVNHQALFPDDFPESVCYNERMVIVCKQEIAFNESRPLSKQKFQGWSIPVLPSNYIRVSMALRHKQPSGMRAVLAQFAQVYVSIDGNLLLMGYVSSCIGSVRLKSKMACGVALCDPLVFEKNQSCEVFIKIRHIPRNEYLNGYTIKKLS